MLNGGYEEKVLFHTLQLFKLFISNFRIPFFWVYQTLFLLINNDLVTNLIVIHDAHSLQSHQTTAMKAQLRLACCLRRANIWHEWLTGLTVLLHYEDVNTKQNITMKELTCTGWNPQLRSSFCLSSVCEVPACEHPPWRTASAYTLSIHFPTLSHGASVPLLSPLEKITTPRTKYIMNNVKRQIDNLAG